MNRRVIGNAAVLAGLQIAAPLCSFLLVAGVSRKLGAAGLGRYSLAYAGLGLISLVIPLGLPGLLIREGARDKALLARLLSSGMILSAAIYVPLVSLLALASYRWPALGLVSTLSLAALPAAWSSFFDAAFLVSDRTLPIAISDLVEYGVRIGGGIAVLWLGHGLTAVLWTAVAGSLVSCLLSLYLLRRSGVPVAPVWDPHTLRLVRERCPVFALSGICSTLGWRVDVLLLSSLRGAAEAGLYTAAYRVLDAAILAPQSLCHALYPDLVRGRRAEGHRWWLTGLTVPAAVGICIAARPLMALLYGPVFEPGAPVLSVLIWTAIPYAWNRYQALVLVASGRERFDLGINAAALGFNVAANLLLIPRFGPWGAAAVTLATSIAYGLGQRAYRPVRS